MPLGVPESPCLCLPPPTWSVPCPPPQSCIDWNREVLKRELGLAEADIIDIPQLFKLLRDARGCFKAKAFFPNMVRRCSLLQPFGMA